MKPGGTQTIAEFSNCSKNILNDEEVLRAVLKSAIRKCGLNLKGITTHKFNPIGVTAVAIIGESHVAIHTYPEVRHVSLDIFTCSADSGSHIKLLRFLKNNFKPKTIRCVELNRGTVLDIKQNDWITSTSRYGFETRYQINKILLSKKTEYQHIDIIENKSFGRMLFLDKDLQIAETDAFVYNSNMILPLLDAKSRLNKVLILGGGDGGVLYECLKYSPKSVMLVDIDNEVIRASKKYLHKICRNAFENPKVKIIIDDANKFLENNKGFDAIIYDLTMYPESISRKDQTTFLDEIFLKIKKSLNKNGIVSLQCCSEYDIETLRLLKKILSKYFTNVNFRKYFIPSFCENWIFASAQV